MEKVFYISKLVGTVEFVLCDYQTGEEWVNATHDDASNGWRFETTDEASAHEMAHIHGGSVESFERAW